MTTYLGSGHCHSTNKSVFPTSEALVRFIKSEVYFPIIVGFHLLLWAVDLAMYDGSLTLFQGEPAVWRVTGEVMSSWVVTVFGFNLLMATRAGWVERVFGGLDKMYLIHRRSGILAAVLLLLHFGTVPRSPDFNLGKPLGFLAMAVILLGVAFAAAPLMRRKLPYHRWVTGHRLMGIFYVFGIAHGLLVPTLISRLPLVRTYVFGMALLGIGAWIYTAFISKMTKRPARHTVTRVRRFGRNAAEIELRPEGEPMKHEAGQFAFFTFLPHAPRQFHPFTIASAPGAESLRIVVKASGDFTDALVPAVEVGDEVRVEGPYGQLTHRHCPSSDQVWVAGGIGITPFLSLARALPGLGKSVKLYWSVRTRDEGYFDEELKELAEKTDGLEYELWQTNEKGYLSVDRAGAEIFEGKDVLICGPSGLRDGLSTQLRSVGTRPRQIHSEEFAFR
jgi:predicted ferric reductase